MKEVIGVRFRRNGKIYYFDPRDHEVELGTKVIVETSKGIEFGWVVIPRKEVDEEKIQGGLKPIQRLATPQDIERHQLNEERSAKAFEICFQKIREHELEMKLISAEYTFDNNKVMFYFTADGRVDFRELVKDLASTLHTRIELRQVGVRDDARIRGGIGMCGRELCCHSYLADFIPVSIKMAKEQSLSLNPVKISGVCGRLMCCLKHEEDTYEYLNSLLPNVGDRVRTVDGVSGEVASVNVLRQRVRIYIMDEEGNKEIVEYKVGDLTGGRRGRHVDTDDSSIDPELTAMEASDIMSGDEAEQEHGGSGGRRTDSERHHKPDRNRAGNRENREEAGGKKGGKPRNHGENRERSEGTPHTDAQKKQKFQKGGKPEGENKETQNSQKNLHRKNRPNNRPRESRKGGSPNGGK